MGGIGLLVFNPYTGIVAFPKSNRTRMYAQETAALKAIQTINAVQGQYHSTFGRFAQSLTELGPPIGGAPNTSSAGLISAALAAGEQRGYYFNLTGTPLGYSVTALPVSFGFTGSRTFYTDQTLVVRENDTQDPATPSSPEVGTAANTPGSK